MAETYEGTLDCPVLNGLRDMSDVLAGYRSTGHYHPERCLQAASLQPQQQELGRQWSDHKRQWYRTAKTSQNAHARHLEIERANEELRRLTRSQRTMLETALAEAQQGRLRAVIRESREYPFCLFPSQSLERLILDLRASTP